MGFVAVCVRLSVGFALLNLLPLAPLTGGYVLDALWPSAAQAARRYQNLIGIGLIVLLATGLADPLFMPPLEAVTLAILGDVASAASWR
jgi:Zn-dependent protease